MTVTDQDILYFITTLKNTSNYDFSDYSEKSLKRRLAKVLIDNKADIFTLVSKIKKSNDFLEKVVREITVNTTELFRDPVVWHALKYRILPEFKNHKTINVWHAGCSTGQEVYSMLILMNEMGLYDKAKVYASDINTEVIEEAQLGEYKYRFNINYLDNFDKVIKENPFNYDEYNDVPYSKYLDIDKTRDIIKMKAFLQEKAVYKKQNLVTDDNVFFVKFDLILCRNVIIYFNYELQNKVFNMFHENLYDNGYLILGMHETILGPQAALFEKKQQCYKKKK